MSLNINSVIVLGVLTGVAAALAGPINPPVGPVTPTPGPEPRVAVNAANTPGDADSLFKITQGGSYYLTGNIDGVAGKHGIEVTAWGVTIDLNGFELNGVAAGTLNGVHFPLDGPRNFTLLNGSILGWDGSGVEAPLVVGCRVEGVLSSNNGDRGINIGFASVMSGCVAQNNDLQGIIVGPGSSVTNVSARGNGGTGIQLSTGSSLTASVAEFNGATGVSTGSNCIVTACSASNNDSDGIRASDGTTVSTCVANNNGVDGIECGIACVIRDNTCKDNADGGGAGGGAGIHATGSGNVIDGNFCEGATRGVDVDVGGNFIRRNVCRGNTTNWTLAADNIYGPIIDRRVPTTVASTPAVNGHAATGTMGTSDEFANFSY